ncbi:AI-2E family transporter [Bradyrhizobium sp. 45]|nr:AI-2E family transporter [Bradyrhizobium sp. 45]
MVASTEAAGTRVRRSGNIRCAEPFAIASSWFESVAKVLSVAESESPLQESVTAADAPAVTSLLSFQIGAVVIAALYLAREVLVPITAAILLSFVLAPLVDLLRRWRLGRIPSVLVAVFAAMALIGAIGTVIGSQVAQLAPRAPEYAGTIKKKIDAARIYVTDKASGLLDRVGYNAKPVQTTPEGSAGAGTAVKGEQPGSKPATSSPLELLQKYLSPILSPFATLGIVLVISIFVLLQKEDLRDRMIRLFGATDLHRTTVALDDAAQRLSRYFLAQLGLNSAFGVIIGTELYFIGVPNPVLWGILSGLLRFVPYIGSFISAGLPITLATAVDPGWSMAIWTAVFYVVVELGVSQGIEPILYGHSTGLSPLAVVVSAIFWSWLWGSIGLVLSMPLTLCLVVLGRYVDRLEFLDILLGDRPPLTPVESFYQRILAGDADEAQDHAELLLKERSLSSYYDEVALKGLQLAANYAERGVIGQRHLERVRNTINELIGELAEHDDRDPSSLDTQPAGTPRDQRDIPNDSPPEHGPQRCAPSPRWQGAAPVLCVASKGPLDEAASAMLALLLGKHGLGARVTRYNAASREAISALDVAGTVMICISYLDIRGSPSHLRYLLQRLKRRAQGVPILVGLWPTEDDVLKDRQIQAVIGADYYVTSLRDAVNVCVSEARKEMEASSIAGRDRYRARATHPSRVQGLAGARHYLRHRPWYFALERQCGHEVRCLSHPNLDELIAFVGGLALHSMIKAFAGKTTAAQVVTLRSSFCTPEKAVDLLRWFWRHQIAVAC